MQDHDLSHPTGPAFEAAEYSLRRLMLLEQKRMTQLLHEHDLTIPQFLVLLHLVHSDRGCAIGDLAGRLFQSNATMTGVIDRLEEEHLVMRNRQGSDDRRKVMVEVTERGRHLLKKASQMRLERTRRVLSHFAPEELEHLIKLLNALANEMEKESR